MIDRPAHAWFQRADGIGIAVLTAGWAAMVAVLHPIAEFPLNDDWIYAGSAKSVVEHGYFWIPGPSIPDLLPLAYWGALFCLPFGFSFTALRLSVLVLGLAGVLALYFLLRRLGCVPALAFAGAAALGVNPLWFNLANVFMTDVPFLAVTLLALLCLAIGGRRATLLGLVLAMVALLIRQTGLFLLIGYAVAYPVARGFRFGSLLRGVVPLLLGLALHLGLQRWMIATGRAPDIVMSDVRGLIPSSFGGFAISSVRATIVMIPYLGAFIFPFVILTRAPALPGGPRRERAARIALVGAAALFLAWIVWKDDGMPVLNNLMYSAGIGPLTLRDTLRLHINEPVVTPAMRALWLAANTIGVAGAFLLLDRLARGLIAQWPTRGQPSWLIILVLVTGATYWAGILALEYLAIAYFDRYTLVLLPLAMIAVAALPGVRLAPDMRRARLAAAAGWMLACAAFGVAGTHDYIAWNRARWQALNDLVDARHIAPERIDGGYEFNGWMYRDPRFPPGPQGARHQTDYWSGDPAQPYVLAFGPIAGYREVARYPVERWLNATYADILVLRRNDAEP